MGYGDNINYVIKGRINYVIKGRIYFSFEVVIKVINYGESRNLHDTVEHFLLYQI